PARSCDTRVAAHHTDGHLRWPDDCLADRPTEVGRLSSTTDRAAQTMVPLSPATAARPGDRLHCHCSRIAVRSECSMRNRVRVSWTSYLRSDQSRPLLLPMAWTRIRHAVAIAI